MDPAKHIPTTIVSITRKISKFQKLASNDNSLPLIGYKALSETLREAARVQCFPYNLNLKYQELDPVCTRRDAIGPWASYRKRYKRISFN